MENARENLVFYFGGGRRASFHQKPVVKVVSISNLYLAGNTSAYVSSSDNKTLIAAESEC